MKKTLSLVLVTLIILSALFATSLNASAAQYREVQGKYNYTYAAQVLDKVNEQRANYGLKPLTMTQSLTDGAMIRAAEATVSFSHTRPNGEQCFTAFEWNRAAGENIAYGQRTPEQVVNAWMNSSGHRANILSSSFTTVGMGCFEYGGTYYWAQAFSGGSGSSYSPSGINLVTVNVSLTSGAQSYVQGVVQETTTKKTETTTRKPAETTTKQPTTTKKAETVTAKSNNKTNNVYSRIRTILYRYRYYYK